MINEQHRAVLNSLQEKRHMRPLAMSIFYEQPNLKSMVYYLFQDSKQCHSRPHSCDHSAHKIPLFPSLTTTFIAVPLFTQFPYLHHCCFQPSPFIFNNQQQINNIQIQNKLMNLTIAFSTNSNFHTILTYSAFTQSFHDHKLTH